MASRIFSAKEVKSRVAEITDAIPDDNRQAFEPWWKRNWLRLAPMLVLVSGIGFIVYKNKDYRSKLQAVISGSMQRGQDVKLIERINTTGSIQLVNLPDGSSVILKKNARITFPGRFEKEKREVTMSGKPFLR